MARPGLFARFLEERESCRDAFEDHRSAAYAVAEEACRGVMLNHRGKAAQIDAYSLFMGTEARAHAYASEELIEHWRNHPRPVYARWEAQWPPPPEWEAA